MTGDDFIVAEWTTVTKTQKPNSLENKNGYSNKERSSDAEQFICLFVLDILLLCMEIVKYKLLWNCSKMNTQSSYWKME